MAADVLADIWDKVLRYIQKYHSACWRSWFEQIEPVSLEHGLLHLSVPERSWKHYLRQPPCKDSLSEALHQITGRMVFVEVELSDQADPVEAAHAAQDNAERKPMDESELMYFSPDYTFNNFVVGPCNRMTHAACIAVSEKPGVTYNPLFIHGDVGLGKTHLLQATCQEIMKSGRAAHVLYLSCEAFVNHFIRAIEDGDLFDFRNRYRHVDMLVIDDIQFLSARDRSQEEFFHTFNTLYQTRKQIVMTADVSPSDIPNLEDRLISRFNQGLVTRIDSPCYETRIAILKKKAQMRSIIVPEDVIDFIAEKVKSNTRELEGALTKVHGMAMLDGQTITLELAQDALGVQPGGAAKTVTITQIIEAVTSHFNVKLTDLQSKRRSRSIALPRQVCMYLARDLTHHSLEEIGGYFGGRDHTTVLHGYRNIDKLCDNDEDIRATVDSLVSSLTHK